MKLFSLRAHCADYADHWVVKVFSSPRAVAVKIGRCLEHEQAQRVTPSTPSNRIIEIENLSALVSNPAEQRAFVWSARVFV
jgi:hypothetical protein